MAPKSTQRLAALCAGSAGLLVLLGALASILLVAWGYLAHPRRKTRGKTRPARAAPAISGAEGLTPVTLPGKAGQHRLNFSGAVERSINLGGVVRRTTAFSPCRGTAGWT